MRHDGLSLVLSATDLSNFVACRHRTALDMEGAAGLRKRPVFDDPLLDLLFQRGIDHEKAYVDRLRDEGRSVVDLNDRSQADAIQATRLAMSEGVDVIVQGALRQGQWFGKPDLLLRATIPSALGDWSYEIADTKLARETRAGTVLQLGLYSRMLGESQGVMPERFHVVTPDPEYPVHVFRLNEYGAYVRLVERQLAETVVRPATDIAAENYPEPVDHCHICPWASECREKRRADDHLSLVAGITRSQRRELEMRGTATLTDLARLPLPIPFRPDRGAVESFNRVREQARLQLESRDVAPPRFEFRAFKVGEGLCRLPAPSPGDLFLDLEGDNLAVEGGREYLFGIVSRGANGAPEYQGIWASNDREERAAFEAVVDRIVAAAAEHPDMHVYHYAPYEATAFRRLMRRYATRENEVDGLLRAGRLVDLYAVVRQGVLAGIERYSIKNLEPLYGYTRDVPLPEAGRALRAFEYALATSALSALPSAVAETVEGYNRDDCVSTLRLYEWLEQVRTDAVNGGAEIPRPTLASAEPSEKVSEKQRRTESLRQRLINGIEERPPEDGPARARWILAYLLDFHRREEKQGWARYFELCNKTDEDLLDEPEAVSGLSHLSRIEVRLNKKTGKPTGSVVDRYTYPPQEMEIRPGAELKTRDTKFGDVVSVDRVARTIDVTKGKKMADVHPAAVFAHSHVSSAPLEDALASLGDSVVSHPALDGANSIARALLLREPPRLTSGAFRQPESGSASDFAVKMVHRLDRSVLAIQGPPGSGKTYTGARMIRALVAQGKRIGVMGPSHKAIANLLEECARAAAESGEVVRVAQRTSEDDGNSPSSSIRAIGDNAEALHVLEDGEADVLGGTAWLWARPDMANSVDVLFVDEAGQVPLANAIAISAAADSMVLLGDPRQLDQPPEGKSPRRGRRVGVAARARRARDDSE